METVYPNNDEIQFRKQHFGVVEDILNTKVECTICNDDLLIDIILKKTIMVHRIHLFLCCKNCFNKLLEDNNDSCILCTSNKDQSICVKCNLNICKRCVGNYKIEQMCDGVVNKCFACVPQMLWKQRAQAANVLKVFFSQLCIPNGLLVNETEHEQAVRKYLIKEAKIGQNSLIGRIKNNLYADFILKPYKLFIINELSEFSFDDIDTIPLDEHLNGFFNIFENILEKTCSTLTNFKSIFNTSSHLSHSVCDMMRSLCIDKDKDMLKSDSIINTNLDEVIQNNSSTLLSKNFNKCTTRILRSQNKHITDADYLNSKKSFSSGLVSKPKVINKKLTVAVAKNQLNKSNTLSVANSKSSNEVNIDLVKDTIIDPEHLFENNDNDGRIEDTRKLSNQNVIKINKTKNQAKNSTKNKKILNKESDGKENNSLMCLNDVENSSKKKFSCDEVITNDTDINQTENISLKISPKKGVNKFKKIDEFDCDLINSKLNDSKTCEETQLDFNNVITIHGFDEIENEEIVEIPVTSDEHNNVNIVTNSKQSSSFTMPSVCNDDNDSDVEFIKENKGTKRMLMVSDSSNDSDSSIKKIKKQKTKNQKIKQSIFDLSTSDSSSSSSDENSSAITVKKRRRIRCNERSDEDSDKNKVSRDHIISIKGRKNIRRLITQKELSESTQNAIEEEELRKKRIQERQKLYNEICDLPTPLETESCKKLVLDFDDKTNEELVAVHPDLVKFLKPHQVKGITFLWDSVFESLSRIKEHKGNGSILAHCMGLGKTLQIIALVHTLFRYPETGIKTVLIITPNATIENWCKEFHKWLHGIDEEKHFFVLNLAESKTYESRKNIIDEWQREHGVLIASYELYRSVVNYKYIEKFPSILEGLVDPGPDLIICDEGHVIKNHVTAVSKSINRIKTLRRIVLTGTPLQNNLKEYHCMVDFIRPNLLGSIKDFTNRFINPITNGQYSDSTPLDVELMKGRSHVLHKMLEGFVQRFDYSVLTPFLPPKHEYVIYLKLSDKQIELYQRYLDSYRQPELFTNYNMLQIVWTHPKLLAVYAERTESKGEKYNIKQKLKDISYIDSFSNSVEEVENRHIPVSILNSSITKKPNTYLKWWKPYVSNSDLESVYPYSKFIMMFSILQECEKIGDKVYGTMEQKIYERQISKLSMAFRVVDEHQIDRHFNAKCQEELYEFEPNTTKPKSTLHLPKDRLMAELILRHEDLVMNILEHDSLLQNNEAEELDENGRNAAWENYKKENDSANVSIEQSILPIFCGSESE
ncbi:transcriptional regulator ATRX-like [Acyrthosiphon pisum]|uniref:Helicase ATP-binding domain-containing protein n=1 Tax=Acyrthosiphon pisum TaxID=7029 RepID=A0A8R2JMN1_ACYPI|nr:transcriptional regulator ATRX-like [Acyrthosiphon pisum]